MVSGQHITVPSMAVTSSPRQYTPFVVRPAAGPRSRSSRARNGAGPIRRRAWASAPAVRGGHREPVESGDHPLPHLPEPRLGEQPGGRQQVDGDSPRDVDTNSYAAVASV
ncbi:hypothetical protein P3H15_32035, partial [Rhodococcus sp. T2V]|nr:hypothetical protein [Rhodococcus sp. T2V]